MTSPITQDDVLGVAPELATGSRALSDVAWQLVLDYVNTFDLTRPLDDLDSAESANTDRTARIYLAAHMGKMTQMGQGAAAGPVTGETVGGVRRSYGLLPMLGYGALMRTGYGQTYLEIVGMSLIHGPVVL